MPLMFTPLTEADIEQSIDAAQEAWSRMASLDIGRPVAYPRRTELIVRAYMDADPEGSVVARQDGKVVGNIFCHAWGDIGWIGPLEVEPFSQGQGVGTRLLRHGIAYLRRSGCKGIGLETMANKERNLRFYRAEGFEVVGEMEMLERSIDGGPMPISVGVAGREEVAGMGPWLRQAWPATTLVPSLLQSCDMGMGRVLLHRDQEGVDGMALVHTFERETGNHASIRLLLIHPDCVQPESAFTDLIRGVESCAKACGRNSMVARLSSDGPATGWLSSIGYRSYGSSTRMVLGTLLDPLAPCILSFAG